MQKYKIVLLGNAVTGKSVWLEKLSSGFFETKYIPTEGASTSILEVSLFDKSSNKDLKVKL